MGKINIVTPNTNVSPTLAKITSSADIVDTVLSDAGIDVGSPAAGTGNLNGPNTNQNLNFPLSSNRGVAGYQWWNGDELWVGNPIGTVIENNQISAWGASNPKLILGGPNSHVNGISVDGPIEFVQTTHGSAATTFNQPVEFNNPIQADSTSVFNLGVTINDEVKIDGTAGLVSPVLELVTDNTGWDKAQMMLTDSNDDVVSVVGRNDQTGGAENYQYNFTLDPNNTVPRTNVGGAGQTGAGDYFVAFMKDYHDTDEIGIIQKVYGAHNGFNIEAYDDQNGTTWGGGAHPGRHYGRKPIRLKGSQIELYANDNEILKVEDDRVTANKPFKLHSATSDPSGENGDMYYKSDTHKIRAYVNGAWIDLN